jgi:tetratricopeptide (TPR) repeat protein/transcriptional regulator with XRE-family HTH domain
MAERSSQQPRPAQAGFGTLLRAHRTRLPLTQEELAERAGLSERTLRNLEGGQVRRPHPDTIRRLAEALELAGQQRGEFEAAARGVTPGLGPEGTAPSLLPPSVTDFTGREEEVADVLELLTVGQEEPTAVVVSAVAGKPGIGKTTLAIQVAHQLRARGRFPDGQLYANLHGAQKPLPPGQVLARFLRALGMDGASIPDSLEGRTERYRTLLADRRILVVLDNAAGEAQVRPLLPGSPSCGVLVTSRVRMAGLEGARLIELDVLPDEAAVELLGRVAGTARVAAEPEAAVAIVGSCGRLPLAIRIAGARLAARPSWSLARLVARLADQRRRLDELAAGDLEVRASIALSYRALPGQQQQAFRRLGLLEAPDFPAWVAGALLDIPDDRAEALVEALVDAQLLEAGGMDRVGQVRYRFHDLLRVYARERAATEDTRMQRRAGLARAMGGWLALAEQADQHSGQRTIRVIHGDAPRWHPQTATTAVATDPLGWFDAERAALVAAVQQASAVGLDELAWDLAGCLARFLFTRNYLDDWRRTQEAGVAAARRAGNRRGQAYALLTLGELHTYQDRLDDALACLEESLSLFVDLGDRHGQASTLENIGSVHRLLGGHELATDCFERALRTFTEVDDRVGAAGVMVALAALYLDQGHPGARACLEGALAVFTEIGDRHTEAQVLRKLAWHHERHGDLDQAANQLTRALSIMRDLDDRIGEALTLEQLGEVNLRLGHLSAARALLDQALPVFSTYHDRYGQARALRARGQLHHAEGRHGRAAEDLEQSLRSWRELDRPLWEARTLADLGDAYAAAANRQAAQAAWRAALAIFQTLGAPDAEALAERLSTPATGQHRSR